VSLNLAHPVHPAVTYRLLNGRVLRPSSVTCVVAKRCVLEQKLLLIAYTKSESCITNRLVPKWMTLTFL